MSALSEKKEKPIIFSTPMVRAILNGKKTITRRILKTPPCEVHEHGESVSVTRPRKFKDEYARFHPYEPYCVGDILWVREKWRKFDSARDCGAYECPMGCKCGGYVYAADLTDYEEAQRDPWKPSIHMKREAARIFLEIVSDSVGRLQEITSEDAIREGFEAVIRNKEVNGKLYNGSTSAREEFITFWDSKNAERGYSWESNPLVWVIEFRRVKSGTLKIEVSDA